MNIDVVCPVYKEFEKFKALFACIKEQKNVNIMNITCSLTLSDNEKIDNSFVNFFKENNINYFVLTKNDFSHSLTRQKLIIDYCKERIVIMLTQDALPSNDQVFYNLAKSIESKETAFNFARQICLENTIEKYIRIKNYPDRSKLYTSKDLKTKNIYALFASDVCACYDRDVFIKLGGYKNLDLVCNEDQFYSENILENGYKKMYVADAVVVHSHNYKIKQLYYRYFTTGKFIKQMGWDTKYIITNSGFKLAVYVLKSALKDFNIKVLFFFIPNMLARYLGMRKGKKFVQKK